MQVTDLNGLLEQYRNASAVNPPERVQQDYQQAAQAAHAAARQIRYLRFQSGEVYRYFLFSGDQYREFLTADSRGRYFLEHIRNRFPYGRLAHR